MTLPRASSAPPIDRRRRSTARENGRAFVALLAALLLPVLAHAFAEAPPEDTVASVLQHLSAIEAESARLAPESPLQTRTPHLAIQLGGIYQGVTNFYAEDRTRYLAVELIVANTSQEPQTLDVQSIRLQTGGKTLAWQDRPKEIDGYSFQAGKEHKTIREVQPPDALAVPAGAAASTWLLFAGLELGGFIPDLTLEIPAEPQPLRLDLRQYEQARLRQSVRRVGPRDCLAVIEIHGELNTVNAGNLATELENLTAAGVRRAVVAFAADAVAPSQFLGDWLRQAAQPNPYQQQFKQLPVFPVNLIELHFVLSANNGGDFAANLHRNMPDAVAAALRTVFAAIPTDEIVQALKSPEPAIRAAALRYGSERLSSEHLPIVARFLDAPEPEVRHAALAALGNFTAPQAVERLRTAATGPSANESQLALRSLAASRYSAAHDALVDLIREQRVPVTVELVAILSEHPRAPWQAMLLEFTRSSDSKVRQAALQALARLGNEQLLAILAEALESDDARLREEAFQRLTEIDSRTADDLAAGYVLQRLKTEPPSASIRQYLEQVRDQRAVPLLLPYLDQPEAVRRGVIELLTVIGDQSIAAEFVRRYPKLSASEQVLVLQSLQNAESPLGRALALEALRSEDVSLVQRAVGYLQNDGDDDVVSALQAAAIALHGKSNQAGVMFLCNGLGTIGSPASRDALLKLRASTDENTRRAAQSGLQILWNQSPAREMVASAEVGLRRARDFQRYADKNQTVRIPDGPTYTPEQSRDIARKQLLDSTRLLEYAARIDADYPELVVQQGVLLGIKGQTDAAVAALRRSLELNSELLLGHVELGNLLYEAERFNEAIPPLKYAFENDAGEFRHQRFTSWLLSLVRIGEMEEALSLVQQHAEKFEGVPIFEYNVACLYGRCVEHLQADPTVAADDPRFTVFTEEAIRLLETSFENGVELDAGEDMYIYMRVDPDLQPLHKFSAFRKFADLDLPDEQRRKALPPADLPGPDDTPRQPL